MWTASRFRICVWLARCQAAGFRFVSCSIAYTPSGPLLRLGACSRIMYVCIQMKHRGSPFSLNLRWALVLPVEALFTGFVSRDVVGEGLVIFGCVCLKVSARLSSIFIQRLSFRGCRTRGQSAIAPCPRRVILSQCTPCRPRRPSCIVVPWLACHESRSPSFRRVVCDETPSLEKDAGIRRSMKTRSSAQFSTPPTIVVWS
ncbi:unnamed protein product [Ixodes persulcatus]